MRCDVESDECYVLYWMERLCREGIFEYKKMPLRANLWFSLLDSITMVGALYKLNPV